MTAGINLVGTFSGAVGTVIAANMVIEALRRGGIPVVGCDLVRDTHGRMSLKPPPIRMVSNIDDLPYTHTLFLDVVPSVVHALEVHADFFNTQRRAFAFYFELKSIPLIWRPFLASFHTLFAPSDFVKDAIAYSLGREALHIPLVPLIERPMQRRTSSDTPFRVLYSFDPLSAEDRKNPLAGLHAFSQAFAQQSNAELILKVWHTHKISCSILLEELTETIHPNIRIIENDLSYDENLDLTASADCYLSLHRGEGLGLTLLEAMAVGTPVIATDYGGSTDFLDPSSGVPIPYTLIQTDTTHRLFTEEMLGEMGLWADANIEAAALALRGLANNPSYAQSLSLAARHRYLKRRDDFLSLRWLEPFLESKPASTFSFSLDPDQTLQSHRLMR